uniref:Uncharacterized protein n=1 Tax=Oryza punctata TaxID=4537 RepID=A0A0E0MCL2_ORYPU
MERLLHFRPPKPNPAHAAAADGDLLELDVLWPASRAPGLLAALPEEDGKRRRKRGSVAVRSAARPIPETAALTLTPSSATAMAKSAPVRIPSESAAATRRGMWATQTAAAGCGGEDGEAMVPPHEIVARRAAAHSSVLEGSGRTLKGRDLHRVRNAVLRRTGFLD